MIVCSQRDIIQLIRGNYAKIALALTLHELSMFTLPVILYIHNNIMRNKGERMGIQSNLC